MNVYINYWSGDAGTIQTKIMTFAGDAQLDFVYQTINDWIKKRSHTLLNVHLEMPVGKLPKSYFPIEVDDDSLIMIIKREH